ncbi:MAG: hypothetical protein WAQ10_03200 [Dethiobacteria bacterium]|jgi:predicted amino acid dehydrogenase|nr:hypothetical protein [Bacillota bacterium]HOJ84031.1 hypothetical protein [Bacillota bacterium]
MVERFAIIINSSRPGRKVRLPAFPASLWSRIAPIKTAALTGISSPFGQASGHFLFFHHDNCRLQQPNRDQLLRSTVRAGKRASRLGARIIGIGPSMAAALGKSALLIARKLGLTLTGGFGYTAAAAVEGLQKAALLMGLNLEEAAVLVLGAAEPLGVVCTQILAGDGANYITLVDGDSARLELLSRRVLYDCGVACRVSMQAGRAAARADLVVIAGNAAGAALSPHDLKPGAVVCNLCAVGELYLSIVNRRPDVMAFDEVVVRLPGEAVIGCDLGLPEGSINAWMAEAVLLALEGRYDRYFLGRELYVEKVAEMRRLSAKHGFSVSGFLAAGRYLDFAAVKRNRSCLPELC